MELRFNRPNGPIDEAIDKLIGLAGEVHHPDIVSVTRGVINNSLILDS